MKTNKAAKTIIYIILIVGSIIYLMPFYWLMRSSLMKLGDIFMMPPIWIPNSPQFSNYKEALTILPFSKYFINTFTIVIFAVGGAITTSTISAYSFARLRWPGRNIIFGIILSGMMLPYAVTIIPTFIGWKFLGFINTYVPLIVPYWFGGGAFYIFLLRQFYLTIPRELDEAAYVDGASYFTIYSKIILPLTKPAAIVVGLFVFLWNWNDFLAPLIYLNDESNFTLALGLQQFQGMYNAQWHLMMAAATVIILPTIIIYFIGQKYFIEGITLTGLKG